MTLGDSGLREGVYLEIPHYQQALDFTCGPACLMMAMAHFNSELAPSRRMELDIWRESNLVEAYACSRQGLAYAAYRRGCAVRTRGNAETIELLEKLGLPLTDASRQVAVALHQDLVSRCADGGIRDERGSVSSEHLIDWLGKGWLPLVLTDARLISDEALPHWVLVVGMGREGVYFHDPMSATGPSFREADAFSGWLGFAGLSCAVVVEGLSPGVGERPDSWEPRGGATKAYISGT